MFKLVINILYVLSEATFIDKGTKIKIKYTYKKVTKKQEVFKIKDGFDFIYYSQKNDKYDINNFIYCKRTIYVPKYKEGGIVIKVEEIKDVSLNIKILVMKNCVIKFRLKNKTSLNIKKEGDNK